MTPIFTQSEVETLEALYPDRDEFFFYLLILADRVQEEEGEAMADGMRFLCEIRQRPYLWEQDNQYWWAEVIFSTNIDFITEHRKKYGNHIPPETYQNALPSSPSLSLMIDAFLHKWARLSPKTRTRLWTEWTKQEVQA